MARSSILDSGRIFYCPSWDHPFYEYLSTIPENCGWPANNDPQDTGQTGVRQTYHYRNTIGKKSGFSGHPPRNWDHGSLAVLSDGFARSTGNTSMHQIPGADMHHVEGYNVMHLDGSLTWYEDEGRVIAGMLTPHTGWDAIEQRWADFFDR